MTSKCRSSVADRRTDKMASVKRIAVVAAVVLLLSMAVVGSVSAATVTLSLIQNNSISGDHGVKFTYQIDGGVLTDYTEAFEVTEGSVVTINAFCNNCTVRPQEWKLSSNVSYSTITKEYCMVTFTMPSSDVTVYIYEGKMLPDGYTEVEYIESEGKTNQNIRLGASAPTSGITEVVFSPMEVKCTTGATYCGIMGDNGSAQLAWVKAGWTNGTGAVSTAVDPPVIGNVYTYSWSGGNALAVNNVLTMYRGGLQLNLFGSEGYVHKARCYSVNIYGTDNSLSYEFVPCYNSEGNIGMYDIVHNQFKTYSSNVSLDYGYKANLVLTYDGNGASGGDVPVDGKRYVAGNIVTILNDNTLSKTGYDFAGWTLDPSGSGTVYVPGQSFTIQDNTTLYAKWVTEDSCFTVSYSANGGTAGTAPTDSSRYPGSSDVTVAGNTGQLTRSGYAFAGWTLTSDGSGIVYEPGEKFVITADTTLYAKWVTPSTTVTLDKNGGVTNPVPSADYEIKDKAVNGVTITASATKVGYSVEGWYTDASAGDKILDGDGSVIGENVDGWVENGKWVNDNSSDTLYAHWVPNMYKVHFVANGGSGTMTDQVFTYDSAQNLSVNTYVKTGYNFMGWGVSSGGSVVYSDEKSVLNLTTFEDGLVTLYAIWAPVTYTVHFNANGGSGNMADQILTYDKADFLFLNEYVKNNSGFSGWATEPEGEVVYSNRQKVTNLSAIQSDVVNLYAVWNSITYTVTIPAFINLDSSGMATSAKYSVTMTSSAIADNLGVITMKLTGSENYAEDPAGFKVKSIDSDEYLRYTIKKNGDTVRLDDEVVSVNVNGSGGISSTGTMSYQLSDTAAYAGVYQDTLTFTMSVSDMIGLELEGGTWYQNEQQVEEIVVPIGSNIKVSGNTVTFAKTGYNNVVLTHSASNTKLLVGYSGLLREVEIDSTIVLDSDKILMIGLPNGYTEVEYIESTGTQNINLNKTIYSGDGRYVEVDFAPLELKGSAGSDYSGIMGSSVNPQMGWYAGGWTCGNSGSSYPCLPVVGTKYTYKWDSGSNKFYINDTYTNLIRSGGFSMSLFSCENTLQTARCYEVRVYDNQGYLVNEYIPCIRNTDSVVGMYDIVNGKFYGNAGTGTIYPGPVVNPDSGATLVTGITLNETSTSISVKGTDELTATVSPTNATYPYVTWISSDTAVAKVDGSGKVTGVGAGKATVTATAVDGSGVTATCTVTVTS